MRFVTFVPKIKICRWWLSIQYLISSSYYSVVLGTRYSRFSIQYSVFIFSTHYSVFSTQYAVPNTK